MCQAVRRLHFVGLAMALGCLPAPPAHARSSSLDGPPVTTGERAQSHQVALVRAADAGDVAAMKFALSRGALLNHFGNDTKQMTALTAAARRGHLASVEMLLGVGADPEVRDGYGQTPLYRAASTGSIPIVKLLLERGVNPNTLDHYNKSPLLVAAGEEIVRLLLRHGARVGFGTTSGGDDLMWAARGGQIGIMRLLLKAGASQQSRDGALFWAYQTRQPPAVLRVLKRAGAVAKSVWLPYSKEDPDTPEETGVTPPF